MTVFVTKGDMPLTSVQLEKRAQTYIRRSWSSQAREESIRKADGLFTAFMDTFSSNHATNVTNNTFNSQLAAYGTATARLAQYVLSVGRAEATEEQGTGAYDEDGNEVTETVVTVTAVEPVAATVEVTTYDDEGEATVETIENPAITVDVSERASAQAVVDGTPQEVKDAA
tara:strand:- start:573 stop:1085 length:513 start_codon:yes stop_codon:yes gene_type:complete